MDEKLLREIQGAAARDPSLIPSKLQEAAAHDSSLIPFLTGAVDEAVGEVADRDATEPSDPWLWREVTHRAALAFQYRKLRALEREADEHERSVRRGDEPEVLLSPEEFHAWVADVAASDEYRHQMNTRRRAIVDEAIVDLAERGEDVRRWPSLKTLGARRRVWKALKRRSLQVVLGHVGDDGEHPENDLDSLPLPQDPEGLTAPEADTRLAKLVADVRGWRARLKSDRQRQRFDMAIAECTDEEIRAAGFNPQDWQTIKRKLWGRTPKT